MKIAVYGIALNEETHVQPFVTSCLDADLILIADTGSTDATVARLRELGAQVRSIRIDPWRFDDARNAALALLPDDVDVCISLDLDQVLSPGWRAAVERAWTDGVNRLAYPLVFRQAGEMGEERFVDMRIHARTGFTWRYPCHEYLAADAEDRIAPAPGLTIIHSPDDTKPRTGYLPLLELAVREAPGDPRASYHLGRELYDAKHFAEAGREFERYFTLPANGIAAERSAALRYLAHCREELGDGDAALTMFRRAAETGPDLRGAWVELAWACHRRQQWPECLAAAERAIAFADEARGYGDETAPGVVAEDIACMAAWALGRTNEALAYARTAAAKAPLNARIRANLERIEAALRVDGPQAFGVSMGPIGDTTPT